MSRSYIWWVPWAFSATASALRNIISLEVSLAPSLVTSRNPSKCDCVNRFGDLKEMQNWCNGYLALNMLSPSLVIVMIFLKL